MDSQAASPDNKLLLREENFWQRYTGEIVVAASALIIQTVIISALLVNLARRRRAERSLAESKNRLKAVLDTSVEGIITINERGIIEDVNKAGEKIFGYSAAEMIGQSVNLLMPPSSNGEHNGQLNNYLQTSEPKNIGVGRDVSGRRKDGSIFPIELSVSELALADRRIFTNFVRDVTARKQLEEESRRHLMELAHVTRVSTLGELSGSLAHELNQPLTAILSNAQAASRFLETGHSYDLDEVRDILKDIVEEDQRAGEIIRRMRSMLKKGKAQLQPLNLNEVIREALQIMHSDLVARNITIQLELEPRLPSVLCDRIQVQQVLINLVLNSSDAMSKQAASERRLVIETGIPTDSHARVTLTDSGPGIPAELAGKIFEPFFSTKEAGLGMGLAICSSIVSSHGGRLWLETPTTTGATFHFTVPLHQPPKA